MWLDSGGDDARRDPAYTVATAPLPEDAIWPIAIGKSGRTVLQLANPGEAEANGQRHDLSQCGCTRAAEGGDGASGLDPLGGHRPGGGQRRRVQTTATDLRGALVSTERLGKVRGLAVVDLAAQDANAASAQVVFDPHAGS